MQNIICLVVLVVVLVCCKDDDSRLGYIFEIVENGNGKCTYNLSYSSTGKTTEFAIVTSCGQYHIGEALEIPK